MNIVKIKDNLHWIGAVDKDLRIFDVVMETKFGTSYNSYLLETSEGAVIFETVKEKFVDEYIEKIKSITDLENIKYIVLQHTEPDHAGGLFKLMELLPDVTIVGSRIALSYLKEITNAPFNGMEVKDNEELVLGDTTFKFISAPLLHWPDTIYTYVEKDKFLFTCDSFGSHYGSDELFVSKILGKDALDYDFALRKYFDDILSPFKKHLNKALDKIKDLEIEFILPGHGPVLDTFIKERIEEYYDLAAYEEVKNDVVMVYASSYGYTKEMAGIVRDQLINNGLRVHEFEIDQSNFGELKDKILKKIEASHGLIVGSTTINSDAVPIISELLINLNPIVHNRKVAGVFGSFGWSGEGVTNVDQRFTQLKYIKVDPYKWKFKPNKNDFEGIEEFTNAFIEKMKK